MSEELEEVQSNPVVGVVKEAISDISTSEEEPIEVVADTLSSGSVKVGEEVLSLQPKETEEV